MIWKELERYNRELREREETIYSLSEKLSDLKERLVRIEGDSIIDPRTELFSSAFFHTRLKEEVIRSERYRHFLSIILIHLDPDSTFSTQHVTEEIKSFGREVTDGLTRRTDILTHFRKRQIAVILPETDRGGAQFVADRYLTIFPTHNHRLKRGVISFPEDASNNEMLLMLLDELSNNLARGTRHPFVLAPSAAALGT